MSTFIDNKENILAWIGSKLMLFGKLGNLIQTVPVLMKEGSSNLDFNKCELIYISDNQKFYLFREHNSDVLTTF